MWRRFLVSFFCLLANGSVYCQTLESGPQEVQLVELYTSEGCSSCPPADRWLSQLKQQGDLWKTIVPIAFHVDYWDYIGWKDGFAQPKFGQRQRLYREQGNTGGVYTPGFVIQGKEWRGWFRQYPRPQSGGHEVGNMTVRLNDNIASIEFFPITPIDNGILNIAVLGFDIERSIKRGENAGVRLTHDFVVLKYLQKSAKKDVGRLTAEFFLHDLPLELSKKWAVAAWLSTVHNQKPIQAVGGWYQPDL